MIEETVINYLIAQGIADGAVYAEVPLKDIPDHYVLIQRSSGSITDYIRQIGLYTEARSRISKLDAAQLHEDVISAMQEIRDHTELFRCKLNAEYDAALTSTKEYRYQALWDITT